MEEGFFTQIFALIFIAIVAAVFWIRIQTNKKKKNELEDYAFQKKYKFSEKFDSKSVQEIPFQKVFKKGSLINYLEFQEKNWNIIWGDYYVFQWERINQIPIPLPLTVTKSFYLFKFNTVRIPTFEMRDKQGLLDFSLFKGKRIDLKNVDKEFDSSYLLEGDSESDINVFLSPKLRKEFCKLDRKHLPSERDLDGIDILKLLSLQMSKSSDIRFYGESNYFMVVCSEQIDLAKKQEMYKKISSIANQIVQDANKDNNSDDPSLLPDSPQDELAMFLTAQETKFKNADKKTQISKNAESNIEKTNSSLNKESVSEAKTSSESSVVKKSNIVQGVSASDEASAEEKSTETSSYIDPLEQVTWLTAMMITDGKVYKDEFRIILNYGLKLGLKKEQIEEFVSTLIKEKNNLLKSLKEAWLPKNDELMHNLIRVAFADGIIAKEELELIRLAAKKMNYNEQQIKLFFEEEKKNYKK